MQSETPSSRFSWVILSAAVDGVSLLFIDAQTTSSTWTGRPWNEEPACPECPGCLSAGAVAVAGAGAVAGAVPGAVAVAVVGACVGEGANVGAGAVAGAVAVAVASAGVGAGSGAGAVAVAGAGASAGVGSRFQMDRATSSMTLLKFLFGRSM